MPIQKEETFVSVHDETEILHIKHSQEAFTINLRAYIDTILPALKFSMDVQKSDGEGMILLNVTSYVSKWKETFHRDTLYLTDVNAAQEAFRFYVNLKICEPEIWTLLSNTKMSYCHGTTLSFLVPKPETASDNTLLCLYHDRSQRLQNLSFLQWLHMYHAPAKKSRGKQLPVFVGIRLCSLFNPILLMLMYFPHNNLQLILQQQNTANVP